MNPGDEIREMMHVPHSDPVLASSYLLLESYVQVYLQITKTGLKSKKIEFVQLQTFSKNYYFPGNELELDGVKNSDWIYQKREVIEEVVC